MSCVECESTELIFNEEFRDICVLNSTLYNGINFTEVLQSYISEFKEDNKCTNFLFVVFSFGVTVSHLL
jgi:hypothetical protein